MERLAILGLLNPGQISGLFWAELPRLSSVLSSVELLPVYRIQMKGRIFPQTFYAETVGKVRSMADPNIDWTPVYTLTILECLLERGEVTYEQAVRALTSLVVHKVDHEKFGRAFCDVIRFLG